MSQQPAFAPNAQWRALLDDTMARIDQGVHPDDATWNAVMDATATDDNVLDALHDTSPDKDALAYDDIDSPEADKQSVILANLQQMLRL